MGLPCAHICDIRKATTGLTPSDFHNHWYWDRKSTLRPILDPLRVRGPGSTVRKDRNTGRILSVGEEQPVKRPPVCTACYGTGHTRSSRNCPLKLQASIAMQSQQLRDLEVLQSQAIHSQAIQSQAIPSTTISITTSIPAYTPLAGLETQHTDSYMSVNVQISPQSTFITPASIPSSPENLYGRYNQRLISPSPETQSVTTQPPKQLSPNRPEVLFQSYLADKEAWLLAHPTIRPTEYRKARKWKTLRPKILREQSRFMPQERRDFQGNIIASKANWSTEEIMVWIDNEERSEQELEQQLQSEFTSNGNRHTLAKTGDIWTSIGEEINRESSRYII